MGYFNRDNRSGGRGDFRRRGFGDRGRERRMYKTICSNCGNECEVPFQPSGDKPVFCSTCFENKRGSGQQRQPRFDDRGSNQPQNDEQFNKINSKLDKILAMLAALPFTKGEEPKIQVDEIVKMPQELPLPSEKPTVIVKKKKKTAKKATT